MVLQGLGLGVSEKDLKHAEDVGDMPRREPVQLAQLEEVRGIEEPDVARSVRVLRASRKHL